MRRLAWSVFCFVGVSVLVAAPEDGPVVSVADLHREPAKYDGKPLVVRGQVSGTTVEGPKWVRLTVKGDDGTVVTDKLKPEGITFVIPKDKKEWTDGWQADQWQAVRMTVEVKQGERNGSWLAVVTGLGKPDGPGQGKGGKKGKSEDGKDAQTGSVASTVVRAEGVGKTADEALKDALRNAVRQVVGAVVDADTLVKNDEVVSDKVLTYSAGLVKKYEEVGKKQKDGLHHVTIRATVERGEVVAKLKAAKVAVKAVDGKGLFAEAVTGLEREKDAKLLLASKLQAYHTEIVQAEAVGKPKVNKAGNIETTVDYRVKLSVDIEKYDAFCKKLLPVLRRIASAKGVERVVAVERSNDHSNRWWVGNHDRPDYAGKATRAMALKDDPNRGSYFDELTHKLWDSKDKSDKSGVSLILVCTEYTKLSDRLTWEWFFVPRVDGFSAGRVHVSVVDGGGREITSNDIPLSPYARPGFYYYEQHVRTDAHSLILSPYQIMGGSLIGMDVVIDLNSKLPTSDLKKAVSIQCAVSTDATAAPLKKK